MPQQIARVKQNQQLVNNIDVENFWTGGERIRVRWVHFPVSAADFLSGLTLIGMAQTKPTCMLFSFGRYS